MPRFGQSSQIHGPVHVFVQDFQQQVQALPIETRFQVPRFSNRDPVEQGRAEGAHLEDNDFRRFDGKRLRGKIEGFVGDGIPHNGSAMRQVSRNERSHGPEKRLLSGGVHQEGDPVLDRQHLMVGMGMQLPGGIGIEAPAQRQCRLAGARDIDSHVLVRHACTGFRGRYP